MIAYREGQYFIQAERMEDDKPTPCSLQDPDALFTVYKDPEVGMAERLWTYFNLDSALRALLGRQPV